MELSPTYSGNQNYIRDKYNYILSNLKEVVCFISPTGQVFASEIRDKLDNSYYKILSQLFPDSYAVTTNYTPLLEHAGFAKPVCLAGKLSQFEIPGQLRVIDLQEEEIKNNTLIFPFIATQSPIKPIIDYGQMLEYSRFIDMLTKVHTLVIIGYGINENDNHINALLRYFLYQNKE